MPVDDMGNLAMTQKEFALRWNVWKALNDWIIMTANWRTCPVQQLVASVLTGKTDEFAKDAFRMGKANKEDTVVYRLKDAIDEFKKVVPLMEEVANPALKERHWKEIFKLLGQPFSAEVPFSTSDLLSYGVMDKIEEVLYPECLVLNHDIMLSQAQLCLF